VTRPILDVSATFDLAGRSAWMFGDLTVFRRWEIFNRFVPIDMKKN
jgi:hypothetical protein